MNLPQHAERLFRRVQSILQFGTVTAPPDDSGPVQTAQASINDLATRDALPVVQQYGFTAVLPVGSKAVILNVSGDASNGIVIGTTHQASRPKGLTPGQVAIFDLAGDRILLTNGAGIELTPQSGQPVTINGELVVNGALNVTKDATIGGIGFLEHVHPGVQQGGATTKPPQE